MKCATKLTLVERDQIEILLSKGYSIRRIATALGRSPNTVSSELRRNTLGKGPDTGKYIAQKAQHKATVARCNAKFLHKKLNQDQRLRHFVIQKLQLHWNPDEIAGYLRLHPELGFYVSKTAIYDWLRSSSGQVYCQLLYSKRYHVKRRSKRSPRSLIPHRVPLSERPREADLRSEVGHYEQDTIVSSKKSQSKACLLVMQERKSRFVAAMLLPSLKPSLHTAVAMRYAKEQLLVQSITYDNGIENRDHERLREVGIKTYFTEPYSSWQKGGVENVNRMLRRYFPKGTDFARISQTDVDHAVNTINSKPRKILGYRSAWEVAKEEGALRSSVLIEG
jgi:IS30 family transposase